MSPFEESLRCLAVSVVLDEAGEVDGIELQAFLNHLAGRDQWLSTTEWLFVEPPAEAEGHHTVPVVMPEETAVQAILNDLTNEPQRSISVRKLEVLAALDARWRHTNTLERIDTGAEALMFNAAVGFVQSVNSRATDEVVANAIAAMRPTSTLPRLLDRFMLRADRLPEHPVPFEDNELRPLRTARSVLAAGRRYRNCLRHRVSDVAAGKMALSEFRGECLVEFRGTTSGVWLLREVHVERNRPVALALCAAVEAKCDALGIPRFCDEAGSGWKSYRKFTGELEWG